MRVDTTSAKAVAVVGVLAGLISAGVVGHARPASVPGDDRTDSVAEPEPPMRIFAAGPSLRPPSSPSASATPVPRPAAPDLLDPVHTSGAAPPTSDGIAQALVPYLGELGGRVAVAVALDGALIYGRTADAALIPASTTKLLTAAAALATLGPDARFTTSVRWGAGTGEIVLVGGGDPLLVSRTADAAPGAASLETLAGQAAAALRRSGHTEAVVHYDENVFSGPATAPGWREDYTAAGRAVVGRISALSVDGGRVGKPEAQVRAANPAAVAAAQFAELLGEYGIRAPLAGPVSATFAAGRQVAAVSSAPLATIVETMLADSDNDLAEIIARQVALAHGEPATFAGGASAILSAVGGLGVDLDGVRLYDGSGLSRRNAITPRALVQVLTAAGEPERSELRTLLTGLPVAGFNGTLDERADGIGAGVVRAKTGTLDGVHALAGTTADAEGRLLVFAVLADRVRSSSRAVDALDAIAGALAACGCR